MGGGGVLRSAPILIVKCTLNLGLMGSLDNASLQYICACTQTITFLMSRIFITWKNSQQTQKRENKNKETT